MRHQFLPGKPGLRTQPKTSAFQAQQLRQPDRPFTHVTAPQRVPLRYSAVVEPRGNDGRYVAFGLFTLVSIFALIGPRKFGGLWKPGRDSQEPLMYA